MGSGLLGLFPVGMATGVGLLGQGEVSADFRMALVLYLALLVVSLLAHVITAGTRRRGDAAAGARGGRRGGSAVAAVLAIPALTGLVMLLRAIGALLAAA